MEVCVVEIGLAQVWPLVGMFLPPLIPLLDPLVEDFEMFRVRHCRVTSLAPALLRMILTACFEGHTLSAPPRPVNARFLWIDETKPGVTEPVLHFP